MNANPASTSKRRVGAWTIAAIVAATIALLLAILAATLYAERRTVAAMLVQRYLAAKGIESEVEFSQIGLGGVLARVRAGSPESPDFTAESIEVTLAYPGSIAAGDIVPQIAAIRLIRPFLRVSFDGERLSFGALQRLVEDASAAGPGGGPTPTISVEEGRIALVTPNGMLRVLADLDIADGHLQRIDARIERGRLQAGARVADIAGGAFKAEFVRGALNGSLTLDLERILSEGDATQDVAVAASIDELQWNTGPAGTVFRLAGIAATIRSAATKAFGVAFSKSESRIALRSIQGNVSGGKLHASARGDMRSAIANIAIGDISLDNIAAETSFDSGTVDVSSDGLSLQGAPRIFVDLAELRAPVSDGELSAQAIRAELPATDARFSMRPASPVWSYEGEPRLTLSGLGLHYTTSHGDLAVSVIRADVAASGAFGAEIVEGMADVSLSADADLADGLASELANRVPGVDGTTTASIARALGAASLRVSGVELMRTGDAITIRARTPLMLTGADGARVSLSPQGAAPLARVETGDVAGAFDLDLRGGGLPQFQLAVPAYRYRNVDGNRQLSADVQFDAAVNLASAENFHLRGSGKLDSLGGRIVFASPDCAEIGFDTFLLNGERQIGNLTAQFCGVPQGPLLSAEGGAWRIDGRVQNAAGRIDVAGIFVAGATGRIQLSGDGAELRGARAQIEQALLTDLQQPVRFRAVATTGSVALADAIWQGDVVISARGRRLASITFRHAMDTGAGKAAIDARNVTFEPGMFQPADIAPMLSMIGTRIRGGADFTGEIVWSREGIASGGHLTAAGVDFQSRIGLVRQASADLDFESLIPFSVAAHQVVEAERIDWLLPLENVSARFAFTPETFTLESAEARVAGGRVSLDPLAYGFGPGAVTQGTLRLANVNVTPLIGAAGLSDRVSVNANIDGSVPFSIGPDGIRFNDGIVAANGPGRLSIRREALTSSVGVGGGGQAPPGAVQDFAYQALENLAFDQLDGAIDSLPMGRLGMIFHVKGRHDPPESAESRVGIVDLLRGRAFDRPLPLPKGTPIDLILDTSLNLDELLASYYGVRANGAPAP